MESCSNNDSKPLLPDSIGTKRDASGWVWGFLFLQKATADGFGLRRQGCGGNDEKDYSSKVIQTIHFALLLLRLLASFHSEKRSLARTVGGEIPAKILSLLLPPNNKEL